LKNFLKILKVLTRHRKIVWHLESTCDVLIYDGEGSDILLYCMPIESKIFVSRIREELSLFGSVSFFIWVLLGFIKYRRRNLAINFGIIKHLKPKVIITYIDNSLAICKIKKIFPLIPVIAVQNGTRWDFSIKNREHMEYDYYFSFGLVEGEIFSQGGHIVSNFYPVGSLMAGIFRQESAVLKAKKFDLCYISQYGPMPINHSELDDWTREVYVAYLETDKRLFEIVVKYAEENNLSLRVAMRFPLISENFARERDYFNCPGYEKIEYIPQSKFSSYRAVQESRLSFTISSTLGYEALGWGERVIFAKDVESVGSLVTQGCWTDNLVTHKLSALQRLHSLEYSELNFKATEILKMTDQNYIEYSKNARTYYMNYDDEHSPQIIIRKKIIELMKLKSIIKSDATKGSVSEPGHVK
jgi:surface carbohydrate biosynthesis protein